MPKVNAPNFKKTKSRYFLYILETDSIINKSENTHTKPSVTSVQHEVMYKSFIQQFPERLDTRLRISDSGNWITPSRFYELTDKDLLDSLLINVKSERSVLTPKSSNLMKLRIPRKKAAQAIKLLRNSLKSIGINDFKTYQTDMESDIHIYIHLSKISDTDNLSTKMSNFLSANGLEYVRVAYAGDYTVIPLQRQFAWVCDNLEIALSRKDVSFELALALFQSDLLDQKVNPSKLHKQLDQFLIIHAKSPECSNPDKPLNDKAFDEEVGKKNNSPAYANLTMQSDEPAVKNEDKDKNIQSSKDSLPLHNPAVSNKVHQQTNIQFHNYWKRPKKRFTDLPFPFSTIGNLVLNQSQLIKGRAPPDTGLNH